MKPGQLSLARVFAKGPYGPIRGTKRRTYLEENAAAVEMRPSAEEVAELEAAVLVDEVVGERYTAATLAAVDR